MKRLLSILLTLSVLLIPITSALAQDTGIINSPRRKYATLSQLLAKGSFDNTDDWQRALKLAQGLEGYADSDDWVAYLEGLISLSSDEVDKAIGYFSNLEGKNFENADAFLAYAKGLKLESLGDILDAAEYYGKAGELVQAQERIAFVTNPENIYRIMQEKISGKSYEEAEALISALETKYQSEEMVKGYAEYVRGLMYLENEEKLEEASKYFSELAKTGFLDSAALSEYTQGRIEELNGDYELALSHYRSAIDAAGRDAVTATDNVRDASNRLSDCQGILYDQAALLTSQREYQQALTVYLLLGNYRDSQSLSAAVQEKIDQQHNIDNLSTVNQKADSLLLTWLDIRSGEYEVRYYPVGSKADSALVATSNQTLITLNDLIPNTEYNILITATDGDSNTLRGKAATLAAPPCALNDFSVVSEPVVICYSLSEAERLGFENVLDQTPLPTENAVSFPAGALSQNDIGVALDMSFVWKNANLGDNYEMLTVLRLPQGGGTYAYAKEMTVNEGEGSFLGLDYMVWIYTRISDLLDTGYAANGRWPQGDAAIEIYINRQLAATSVCVFS